MNVVGEGVFWLGVTGAYTTVSAVCLLLRPAWWPRICHIMYCILLISSLLVRCFKGCRELGSSTACATVSLGELHWEEPLDQH